MNDPLVIVGAGISGLLLAHELQRAGTPVVVLEKSRGVGGRLASKRIPPVIFDQGAQYFTAKEPRFTALLLTWTNAGVVAPWPGPSSHRWIGRPTINALGKHLATGLEVRRESRVLSARRDQGSWTLAVENQSAVRTNRLVLTAPVPQSLALLEAGGTELPASLGGELAALTYHPCLALLLTLAGPSAIPTQGLALENGPVRWIADNTKKGVSPGENGAVTVHLSADFAAEHYTKTETELAALIVPLISSELGAEVTSIALHRWKFSEPARTHAAPCVWEPALGLGFAGDAFGGPRVEGAALSGWALADLILGR